MALFSRVGAAIMLLLASIFGFSHQPPLPPTVSWSSPPSEALTRAAGTNSAGSSTTSSVRFAPSADISTTMLYPLTGPYSVSDFNAYCIDHQSEGPYGTGPYGTRGASYAVTSVDLATFSIVLDSRGADSGFARDKYHVYAGCDGIIPNADPATFVTLADYSQDGGYTKDSSHVWFVIAPGGGMDASWGFSAASIEGADPTTFVLAYSGSGHFDAKDRNREYLGGQIVQ